MNRGGKQVYTGTAGYSDVELEVPYRTNTISRIMSMSKPVTATAIMILIDEGKIKLTDPLYKFNDKFRTMTVIDQVNEEDGTVISTVPAKVSGGRLIARYLGTHTTHQLWPRHAYKPTRLIQLLLEFPFTLP